MNFTPSLEMILQIQETFFNYLISKPYKQVFFLANNLILSSAILVSIRVYDIRFESEQYEFGRVSISSKRKRTTDLDS